MVLPIRRRPSRLIFPRSDLNYRIRGRPLRTLLIAGLLAIIILMVIFNIRSFLQMQNDDTTTILKDLKLQMENNNKLLKENQDYTIEIRSLQDRVDELRKKLSGAKVDPYEKDKNIQKIEEK
eukprot:44607_1